MANRQSLYVFAVAIAFVGGVGVAQGEGANVLNPDVPFERVDEDLPEVDLEDGEVEAIEAFLEALNDTGFFVDEPAAVPSGLPVGGFE